MPRWLAFATFLSVILSIFVGVHVYVYLRLHALFQPTGNTVWLATVLIGFVAVLPVGSRLLERWAPILYPPTWWLAAVWMGVAFYLFLFLLGGHVIEGLLRLTGLWPGPPWLRATVGVPLVGALVTSALAILLARRIPKVIDLEIPIPNLPPEAEGLSIVQISDFHLGSIVRPPKVERIVDRIASLEPDIVVSTGDLVDEAPERLEAFVPLLAKLRPRLGTFAITGNHEFYAGAEKSVQWMHRAGIRVLHNEWVEPVPGLLLFGLHDPTGNQLAGSRWAAPPSRFADLLGKRAKDLPTILLYHQPLFVEQFAALGVNLMLSGHTHAGQLWPFRYLSALRYRHVYGRYQVGSLVHYVSAGTGTWGPPMRLGAPQEIVRFTLRSKPLDGHMKAGRREGEER